MYNHGINNKTETIIKISVYLMNINHVIIDKRVELDLASTEDPCKFNVGLWPIE